MSHDATAQCAGYVIVCDECGELETIYDTLEDAWLAADQHFLEQQTA
jgi:hypothetical protein